MTIKVRKWSRKWGYVLLMGGEKRGFNVTLNVEQNLRRGGTAAGDVLAVREGIG